jgi:uncharacterized protein
MTDAAAAFNPASITRPDPALRTYYILTAMMTIFGFPFVILPLMFKYHTLKYHFDDRGVKMSWGVLFHREMYLTYRRIQDIHVSRNFVQRWMGLANLTLQTASGSGGEMTIEGIINPEHLRDYLYQQMRGAKPSDGHAVVPSGEDASVAALAASTGGDEALQLLREIRDEVKRLRPRNS